MLDVYNSLLKLAHERIEDLTVEPDHLPARMPAYDELSAALARVTKDRHAVVDVTADPILRRALLRILAVNQLVLADSRLVRSDPEAEMATAGRFAGNAGRTFGGMPVSSLAPWPRATSGEMLCPECRYGSLCYLIGAEGGAFVECSTIDCLYWDLRRS